jgi:hypothetical protein
MAKRCARAEEEHPGGAVARAFEHRGVRGEGVNPAEKGDGLVPAERGSAPGGEQRRPGKRGGQRTPADLRHHSRHD